VAAPAAPPARAFNIFLGGGVPGPHQRAGLVGPLTPLLPLKDKMAFLRGIQGPDATRSRPARRSSASRWSTTPRRAARRRSRDHAPRLRRRPAPDADRRAGDGLYYKFLDNPSRW